MSIPTDFLAGTKLALSKLPVLFGRKLLLNCSCRCRSTVPYFKAEKFAACGILAADALRDEAVVLVVESVSTREEATDEHRTMAIVALFGSRQHFPRKVSEK